MSRQFFLDQLPAWAVPDPDCGVVTAADCRYFYGLRMLLETVLSRVQVVVIDVGLTDYQRRWLDWQGITVKVCPLTPEKPDTHKTSWLKPWWIAQAGLRYALWIDADALVVGDLTPLFARIKEHVLLIQHPYKGQKPANSAFNPVLAKRFPVKRPNQKADTLNAGVLGLALERAEDKELLKEWQGMIEHALAEPGLQKFIPYWDEGAMHWAMAKLALQDRLVRDQHGWDRFVYMPHARDVDDMYARLPIQDGDTILHFVNKKPWLDWTTWMPV